MWRILLMTGARVSEMLALEKADLTLAGSRTKNRKVRYVPIPDSLRAEIDQWSATVPGHLLFPTPTGVMHSRNGDAIQGVLERARTATGIQDLTFRRCRTTFATLYEGDPRDAQAILGHSTIDLTMNVYRKPIATRQQADVEALEARLSGKVLTMPKKKEA